MEERLRIYKSALMASALFLSACASGGGGTPFTPTSTSSTSSNTSAAANSSGVSSETTGGSTSGGASSGATDTSGGGIVATAGGGGDVTVTVEGGISNDAGIYAQNYAGISAWSTSWTDVTVESSSAVYGSDDGTSAWTDGGAGSYGDSAIIDPDDPYSGIVIGAPDPATLGGNATPIVISEESDPNFLDGSANGTDFPLVQSVIEITENGTAPEAAVNDGGATLSVIDIATGEVNLSIPSLGIDVDLFANADDPAAITDGFASLAGATGNWLLVGGWGAGLGDKGYVASFVTGYRTPADAVPTSGTANFEGPSSVVGSVLIEGADNTAGLGFLLGDASFVVDFAAGTVEGAFTNMTSTGLDGAASDWNDVSVEASLSGAGGVSTLSGTTGASSAPGTPFALGGTASGHINGGLFGPSAEELGAVWSLSDGNGAALGTVGAGATGTGGSGGITIESSGEIDAYSGGGADVTINDTTTP